MWMIVVLMYVVVVSFDGKWFLKVIPGFYFLVHVKICGVMNQET
jgi:hypothetical protein